ncbi:MAG: glycosyltransferase [Cyclobacteriaceae bacterium]|nr:glycosyltransferase [Cyclobacteriaceae bacterium]
MPSGNSLFHSLQAFWLTKAKPLIINFLQWIKVNYFKIKDYYATHPKQRKWTIAGLFVMGPPLLLLMIVWIEIPGKKALRNIQNQLPSEIYSADSVLIGRFFVQDRTEVGFEQIAQSAKDALIAVYYSARALWFTSNARNEGFGQVQVESMACSTPVINAHIPNSGVDWVSLDNVSGLTTRANSVESLAEASIKIASNDELYCRLSHGARQRAIGFFDAKVMAEESIKLYSHL